MSAFDDLAKDVLLAMVGGQVNYVPPENAHMLVNSSLAIADEFMRALVHRRANMCDSELHPEEIAALQDKGKIQAVKMVRLRTGLNLKEAKEIVDREQARFGL